VPLIWENLGVEDQMKPMPRGTFRVYDFTGWSKGLTVTADGDAVIPHAGAAALRLTADRTGLTTALSRALQRDGFTPGHDRGRVLTDTALMMADGGNTVRGIDVLRHQRDLLGEVASAATVSRALAEVDQQTLERIDAARAQVRARVWKLIVARHGRIPPARVPTGDLGGQIVLRIDAHFINVYSRKEHAGRLRGRYGLHPLAVVCDNTDECLADQLRPGTAGANDAADHITLLTRAIAQIPEPWRRNLLITADGAGATHKLLNWLTELNREPDGDDAGMRVEYTVGWPVDKHTGRAIAVLPPQAWTPMLAVDGAPGIPATWTPPPGRTPSDRSPRSPTCWPTYGTGHPGCGCSPAGSNRCATPPRNRCPACNNWNWTCNSDPPAGATKPSPPTPPPPGPTSTPTRSPPGWTPATGSTPA
jgi:hypothetical protein